MRVLVTGAAGFTGRHLVAQLLEAGHRVSALEHPSADLTPLDRQPNLTLIHLDLAADDVEALVDVLREHSPDQVYHLAGVIARDASAASQEAMFRVNVVGTLRLLQAIELPGINPVVLVPGSSSQYGEVPMSEQPIRETTPFRPTTLYAASKIAQEMTALHFHRQYGLRVICTRTFNLTGPGERADFVCSAFARQLACIQQRKQESVVRVGNLETERDLLDVRDATHAYRLLAERGTPGGVYNVASGRPVAIAYVLETLIRLAGVQVQIVQDPGRLQQGDVASQRADLTRVRTATGWVPAIPLEKTLADLLDDWRRRVAMENVV